MNFTRMQIHRQDFMADAPPSRERLQSLARSLHRLGERATYELLAEIAGGADLWERLERYAALEPLADFISANGGDVLPVRKRRMQ